LSDYFYLIKFKFRIRIDLKTRTGSIALHINPRLSQSCIVRNSNLGGWGAEERAGPMPFKKGKEFEVIILVEEDKYMVRYLNFENFEFFFFEKIYNNFINNLRWQLTENMLSSFVTDVHIQKSQT
jgi:hypothetical protein